MIAGEYTGSFSEGVREGKGKLTWANGDVYEGEFVLKAGDALTCILR